MFVDQRVDDDLTRVSYIVARQPKRTEYSNACCSLDFESRSLSVDEHHFIGALMSSDSLAKKSEVL
jgi:hypothetical protein